MRSVLLTIALLLTSWAPQAAGLRASGAPAVAANQLIRTLPDSVRLKMLAALARGDISEAAALWQVATGRTDLPAWLRAFQAAFDSANQRAGPCIEVAKATFEGFRQMDSPGSLWRSTCNGSCPLADVSSSKQ